MASDRTQAAQLPPDLSKEWVPPARKNGKAVSHGMNLEDVLLAIQHGDDVREVCHQAPGYMSLGRIKKR